MKRMKIINKAVLLFTLLCFGLLSNAQTVVKGFVKDATTMKPIQFVSIYFEGGKGVTTGEDGSYSIGTILKYSTSLSQVIKIYQKKLLLVKNK
jgi:hypothetical protein